MRGCDHGWILLDGSCYKYFEILASSRPLRERCTHHESLPISVNTKEENDLLKGVLLKNEFDVSAAKVFIGLKYNSTSQKFFHIDKSPVIFTAWARPTTLPSKDSCVALHKNGSWYESQCQRLVNNYVFCEKRG